MDTSSTPTLHTCGGTILTGGTGDQAHLYCDRCRAFTHDIDGTVQLVRALCGPYAGETDDDEPAERFTTVVDALGHVRDAWGDWLGNGDLDHEAVDAVCKSLAVRLWRCTLPLDEDGEIQRAVVESEAALAKAGIDAYKASRWRELGAFDPPGE
jgi:hypothetical protein